MRMDLPVICVSVEGERVIRGEFELEVAFNEEDCLRGLMFRQNLEDDRGLLLRNPAEGTMSIWMKDTTLSLDLVFIGPDWRITTLVENMRSLSEDAHVSNGEAVAAIEFTAGTIRKQGIMIGDGVYRIGERTPDRPNKEAVSPPINRRPKSMADATIAPQVHLGC
jgi:uncharacterized membrane protein (UPF0127 family)